MEFCTPMFIKEKKIIKKVALSALDPLPFVLARAARRVGLFLTARFHTGFRSPSVIEKYAKLVVLSCSSRQRKLSCVG